LSALLLSACLSICIGLHAQTSYARGDSKTILAVVDNNTVVYCSDAGEVFRGSESITTMLSNDARLWSGLAHIGDMRNVTNIKQGNLE
jgi:hypothetical protein